MITVLALLTASVSLYFSLKKTGNRSQEEEDFRKFTEQMIVEFNRVTARNIALLDDKIEDLEHKIRLCIKMDRLLKERFEEADKLELFQGVNLSDLYTEAKEEAENDKKPVKKAPLSSTAKKQSRKKGVKESEEKVDSVETERKETDVSLEEDPALLEKSRQELLLTFIKEGKKDRELSDRGFSIQEINIAKLRVKMNG